MPATAAMPATAVTPATAAMPVTPALRSMPAMPAGAPNAVDVSIARVAQISPAAQVVQANVERPANVARVAAVARPGVSSSVTRASATQPAAPAQTYGQGVARQTNTGNQRFGSNPEDRSQQGTGDRDTSGYGIASGLGRRAGEFSVPNVVATTSAATSAAQRVADIVAAREDAPARPLSQIVMAVDAGNGTMDRIQLDLRGSSLNAAIDVGDQRAAHTMSTHKPELVRALTRDGLEVESLEIRGTTATAAPVAAESAHRSSDSSSNSRSDRGAQWQQQQHRQRSEQERRQQQRDERGGTK
jgi:hypothetical protein